MRSSNAPSAALIAPASLVARIGCAVVADSPVEIVKNDFVMTSSVSVGPTFPYQLRVTAKAAEPLGECSVVNAEPRRRLPRRRAADEQDEQVPLSGARAHDERDDQLGVTRHVAAACSALR